jgi:hypothetical protein
VTSEGILKLGHMDSRSILDHAIHRSAQINIILSRMRLAAIPEKTQGTIHLIFADPWSKLWNRPEAVGSRSLLS